MGKHFEPGDTFSEGTLKTDDIGFALIDALDSMNKRRAATLRRKFVAALDSDDLEAADEIIYESLYPALEDYAPDGCYIGSIEGDGACIGCWQIEEAF